jgi:hypothetical protein
LHDGRFDPFVHSRLPPSNGVTVVGFGAAYPVHLAIGIGKATVVTPREKQP